MITRVQLENFKRFQKVDLTLKPFTVLMGENGSGKTSLLQAIALSLRILGTTDLVRYDGAAKKVRFRSKGVPYTQLPGLTADDPSDIFWAKTPRGGAGGGVTPIRIELTDNDGGKYRLEITSLFGAFTVKNVSVAADFPKPPTLQEQRPLFVSGFVGIPTSEERYFPKALDDRLLRGRASEVLRNLLLDTYENDPDAFDRLKSKIKTNFQFEIGAVRFNPSTDLTVHASYAEDIAKRTLQLDLSTAGSGFLQVLQILTPIYRYAKTSKVVLIDEPDAHLHPNLQRTIARLLQEIAVEEGLQIIISTHSTAIIREVDAGSIIPVTSSLSKLGPLGSSADVESAISFRLDNFTAAKAKIAGRLVFFEDSDLGVIEKMDAILGTGVFEGPAALPVLSASGKDDKIPFRIGDVVNSVAGTDVEVVFVRDGDGLPTVWRDRLKSHADDSDVLLILLERHEIESYLINVPLLSRLLAARGKVIDEAELTALCCATMQDIISKAKFGFDKTLRDVLYKTARLMNLDYSFGDAEKEAASLRSGYEELSDFNELVAVAPGKESLKELLIRIKAKYGEQLSQKQLAKELTTDDVDPEIVAMLSALGR